MDDLEKRLKSAVITCLAVPAGIFAWFAMFSFFTFYLAYGYGVNRELCRLLFVVSCALVFILCDFFSVVGRGKQSRAAEKYLQERYRWARLRLPTWLFLLLAALLIAGSVALVALSMQGEEPTYAEELAFFKQVVG